MSRPRGRRRPLGLCITAPGSARGAATSAEHVVPATVALATAESPRAWTWLQRAPTLLLTQEAVPGLWVSAEPHLPEAVHTTPQHTHNSHCPAAGTQGRTQAGPHRSPHAGADSKRCHDLSARAQTTGCFEITQGSVLALVGCPRVLREDPKARATREKSRGWTPRAMVCPSKDRTQRTQTAHGMFENTCESQRT